MLKKRALHSVPPLVLGILVSRSFYNKVSELFLLKITAVTETLTLEYDINREWAEKEVDLESLTIKIDSSMQQKIKDVASKLLG